MRHLLSSFTVLALAASASAQTTWYVNQAGGLDTNPGTSALPFRTINKANTVAVSGDIVRLAAGLYNDPQGTIILGDKSLTLVGAGAGLTVIRPHSSLTTNIPTGTVGAPVATQQRPIVLVEGQARVDFYAITFDGNFQTPANGRLTGVYFRNGADGELVNCEIKNCSASPANASAASAGVIVRGDNLGDECNVVLRNCYIHTFGKSGAVTFFNATLEVEETRVVGIGPIGGLIQNGIQVSYDGSASIRRSTITNMYDDGGFSATGILAYGPSGTLDLEDNNIGGCELGIFVGADGAGNNGTAVAINRNRVHCADAAIQLNNMTFAEVVSNSFHVSDCNSLINVATDNRSNKWDKNSYSDYSVPGYVVQGGGGNIDLNAKGYVDLLSGTPVTTVLNPNHSPYSMVVGNFDGANFDDFATVELNGGLSLTIGLNTGANSFATTNINFGTFQEEPVAIVKGQFKGGAGIDLAVATRNLGSFSGNNRVYIFENTGGGVFAAPIMTPLLGFINTGGLAAGNVNGDGYTDLVATDLGPAGLPGAARLLLADGGGAGTFTGVPLLAHVSTPFTTQVRGATIARINADGDADVVLIEGDGLVGKLHRLWGNGAGVFVAVPALTIGVDPTAIVHSDFNNDLDNDLLVAFGTQTGGAVDTFTNDGAGNFTWVRCRVHNSATGLAVGDLDNDADPDSTFGDAAVINYNGGSVTLLGTYVDGAGFGAGGLVACGITPTGVAFGNFNGDPYQDLFYCNAPIGSTGSVTVVPGVVTARTDFYGNGCAGAKARIPYLQPIGAPGATQPNATYGVGVRNARPQRLAIIAFAGSPGSTLAPCNPMINLGTVITSVLRFTNNEGAATVPLPLPATPALGGYAIYAQTAVLDEDAPNFLPGLPLSMSKGLKIRIGK